MAADEADELEAQIARLRAGFAAGLPQRLDLIDRAWERLPVAGRDDDGWRELRRLVHSLSGSAGMFGFTRLSDQAQDLEQVLEGMIEATAAPDPEQRGRIRLRLDRLRRAAEQGDQPG